MTLKKEEEEGKKKKKKKMDTYYGRFKNHVQPKRNPIFERSRFNNEVQGSDSIDAFVTRLKLRAQGCNYAERDNMIRDSIVFGCSSEKCREKLLYEGEKLTMDRAVQIMQKARILPETTIVDGPI